MSPIKMSSHRKITKNKKKPITRRAAYDKGLQLIKASRKSKFNRVKQFHQNKQMSTSLNDSVIIISDSENEQTENVKCATENNKNETAHTNIGQLFKSFNCLRKANKHAISNMIANTIENNKLRNRRSIRLSNPDASCCKTSESKNVNTKVLHKNRDNEKPINNKLNESVDDIVVVWSSIDNSSITKFASDKTNIKNNISNEENHSRLFMLDYDGNSNNLKYLKSVSQVEQNTNKPNDENKLLFNKPGLRLPRCMKPNYTITVEPQKNMKSISAKFYRKQINNQKVQPDKVNKVTHNQAKELREIIIDGCNVAMAHSHGKTFSETGLQLVIDYFKKKGHSVKVFVPQHKRSLSHPLLEKLWKEGTVVFTPSRKIAGKYITSYDDRFILEYATICKGIVVSLDQYRDLYIEKPEWRDTIENRLLAPTFVGNYVMFPDDPLGRDGPTLAQFLRHDT